MSELEGAPARGPLYGLHLLVVDDNEDVRQILRMLLTYFGAAVTVVKTAGDALTSLREVMPDVVIADMVLGPSSATWLIGEARRLGIPSPFIAISGHDFDEPEVQKLGFELFMQKPLNHDRVIDAILRVIKSR